MEARKSGHWMFDRWSCLAAAMIMEACGGLGYTFAVYSQHIKETLDYDQEDLDKLGAAKDFGYCLGIIGGIIYNLIPPWMTIGIGATLHFFGYSMLWMTTSGQIEPPGWMLCGFIAVGVGGDSWIDAAAIMTSLQNFDKFRGTAMGVLKAQVGLCGAIFVTLYKAFLKPDVDAYILLVATAPAVTSVLLAVFVWPHPCDDEVDAKDTSINKRFHLTYAATIILGLYLLCSVLLQAYHDIDRSWLVFFAVTMLINLFVISGILVVFRPLCRLHDWWTGCRTQYISSEEMVALPKFKRKTFELDSLESSGDDDHQPLRQKEQNSEDKFEDSSDNKVFVTSNALVHKKGYEYLAEQDMNTSKDVNFVQAHEQDGDLAGEIERYTLWDTVQQLNFWLLSFVTMFGAGSGLAVINNFGQIGKALGSESVELFVGLISIASCFGRLIAGYGSDVMLRKTGYPRPLCLSIAHAVMTVGCLTLAAGTVPMLYFGAALVGGSYGAFWSLTPAIISEVFGLHNFAALYKLIGACGPVGAYVLSAKVVGYLYDEEAEYYQSLNPTKTLGHHDEDDDEGSSGDENICQGRRCFGISMSVLACVCVAGACLGACLAKRTMKLYARTKKVTTPSV
ncbi:hypothetical protein Mapa_013600 [Marchantia paleacea]|nr:hypothetical protein Mapa_013600 [Marchantia paleacea]